MKILVLGASGSIGEQTLDIISSNTNDFELVGFSVGNNVKVLKKILKKFPSVKYVCVKNEEDYLLLKKKYINISFYYGDGGLISLINNAKIKGTIIPNTILEPEIINVFLTDSIKPSNLKTYLKCPNPTHLCPKKPPFAKLNF